MKELFLIAALALPSSFIHFGPAAGEQYSELSVEGAEQPTRATPHWDFGPNEVKIVRMLRDYANGETASRPQAWVLIYGRHPLWVHMLRDAATKIIGMYHQKLGWPFYIVGDPLETPFRHSQFQVYIYDDFVHQPLRLSLEVSRIVASHGFFLYRYTKDGNFAEYLERLNWQRFDIDFHEFTIWWRPKYFPQEIVQKIIYRKGWRPYDPSFIDRLSDWMRKLKSSA